MSDPEISTVDFSEDKLASNAENEHAPAWFDVPRWNGGRPPITPARARAIEAKRAFEKFKRTTPLKRLMTGEEFILRSAPSGDLVGAVDWRDIASTLPVAIALACFGMRRHVLVLIAAAMRKGGYLGVAATWRELAQVAHKSPMTTRRIVAELVELELLLPPVALFTKYGAVWSQRGNAFRVGPAVYAAVDVARVRRSGDMYAGGPVHGTGAEMNSHPDNELRSIPGSGFRARSVTKNGCSRGPEIEGSAAPTGRFAGAPGAAADEAGRCTRQDANASSAPEAPERASVEHVAACRELYERLIGGDDIAIASLKRWKNGGAS